MLVLPPLSLYIHVPWCVRKCPYCDFNSHAATEIPEAAYLEQLKQDLSADVSFVQGREIQSIFIGGGTPSLMSGEFYDKLLSFLAAQLSFSSTIEVTMEANPGTFEADRFKAYRLAGVNRLSLGVQSFNNKHLETLGRIHSGEDAKSAIDQLDKAGFDNFNLDLMHGLPEQTPDQALEDLSQAIAFSPTHLSWYQLTIEQNTEFYRYPPTLPSDERLWEIQEQGMSLLAAKAYQQYEVSAFAKEGKRSKHNTNYWTFGDYLGIGAGAHAKVTQADGSILRYRKTRLPADYLRCAGLFRRAEEVISAEDLPFEFLMNVLRLKTGVDRLLFEQRTGLPLAKLEPQLTRLVDEGLMEKDRLATTDKGFLFLNELLERFA